MKNPAPHLSDQPDLLGGVAGIVFDKDGTLTDLSSRWFRFFDDLVRRAVEEVGGEEHDHLLESIGIADGQLVPNGPAAVGRAGEIERLLVAGLQSQGADVESAANALKSAQQTARFGGLAPLGNIVSALESLGRSDIRMGVATADWRANTLTELEELKIEHFITAVRCGDDDGPVKPDGDVLRSVATEWGVELSQLLFVGDSNGDAMTAESAGVTFVSVGRDTHAHAWVNTIEEIASLL